MLRVFALPPAEGPVYPRRMTTTDSHGVCSTSIRISTYGGRGLSEVIGCDRLADASPAWVASLCASERTNDRIF